MLHDVVRETIARRPARARPGAARALPAAVVVVLRGPGAHPRARAPVGGHRGPDLPHREPRPARRLLPGGGHGEHAVEPAIAPTSPRSGRSSRRTRSRAPPRCWAAGGTAQPEALLRGPRTRRDRRGASCTSSEIERPRPRARRRRPRRAGLARPPGGSPAAPPGTGCSTMRRWLGRDTGEMLSPAVGACWLDVKRAYMELRPRLSRLYSVMADPDALAPIFVPLGFAPIGEPVDVGGSAPAAGVARLRRGERRRLAAAAGRAPRSTPRRPRCAPAPDGPGGGLTPREIEVLALIWPRASRTGASASGS